MAIKGYFFNALQSGDGYDRTYNAEDVTSYLDKILTSGVFPNPSTQLQVRAGSGMQVIVAAGQGWIDGHKMINTADYQLDISQSDVLLDRIDAVVFYADKSTREMGIAVKSGTPATSPAAPVLVQNETRHELCLAQVRVAKQATEITNSAITDTRGDESLCGWVTGLIREVDTATLYQQWQAGYEEWYNDANSAFWEWFDEVKESLSKATLIRKYNSVYTTTEANESTFDVKSLISQYSWAVDVLEIRINGLALTTDEYTKETNTITLVTPITQAGTPIEFVIYKAVDTAGPENLVDMFYALRDEVEKIRVTSPDGEAKQTLTESTEDVLDTFSGFGVGFHTLEASAEVGGAPDGKAARYFGHMTSENAGYIFAVAEDGSIYSNVYAGTWTGWRTLYDASPARLWYGIVLPAADYKITPSKKLSECRNGWALTWCKYENGEAIDDLVQTTYIPKKSYKGTNWGAETIAFGLMTSTGSNAVPTWCIKTFEIADHCLVSNAVNAYGESARIALRSIYEY